MNWTLFDFLVAGALLTTLALGLVVSVKFIRRPGLRLLACGAVVLIVGLIWAEGAVGIFD
tara:strand:+ start:3022 stop:3201 length:180 start_codon:yes stop_codon:yes gene_type:complete